MNSRKKYDVVVVGELNADLILSGISEPRFNQVETLVEDAVLALGSSSAIFACGAARLGLKVAFIGKVGRDPLGRFVIDQLDQRHVDTSMIIQDGSIKTGISVILNCGIDRAILTYSGSIGALRFKEIDMSGFTQARHFHLGGYFLLEKIRPDLPSLFKIARKNGLTTSMDTNYDPAEEWNGGVNSIFRVVDIFFPNEKEICAITGKNDPIAAAQELTAKIPLIALKMGEQGGKAINSTEIAASPILPVKVVDTVGAGDSFDAGFIFAFLKGMTLQQSIHLACVCGSLSTRAAGGIAGQPSWDEANKYL